MDIEIPRTKDIYQTYFYNARIFRYNPRMQQTIIKERYVNQWYVQEYVKPFIYEYATNILKNHWTNLRKSNRM